MSAVEPMPNGQHPRNETVAPADQDEDMGRVSHPAKVFRLGLMVARLLNEARLMELDEASRGRMGEIYRETIGELSDLMSPDLRDELMRLSPALEAEVPTAPELRVAHAQLLGWLEGLLHGIQTAFFEQFLESQRRLEEMRKRGLGSAQQETHAGTYL
jgi:hypothetical protein